MRKLLLTFCLFAAMAVQEAKAQIYDFGASFGVAGYVGDLQPRVDLLNIKPGGGIWFKYNFNPHWGIRAGYFTTDVAADDANAQDLWRRQRNLNFESYISELGATVEFNFFRYITGHVKYNHTPFVFVGLARFRFNPTTVVDGRRIELQALGTEGQGLDAFPDRERYNLVSMSIPFGIGYRWNFYKFHSLVFEISGRYAFTDYLDDVSLTYPGADLMLTERGELASRMSDRSGELGIPLREPNSQRGINTFNDAYWYVGLSYILTINSGRCPRFR
ncbi:MAG: DUF6089 family protein [Bacteroidia bacterium]